MLPPEKDPLGRALLDFQAGKPTPDIWVGSDLAEDDYYEVAYYFRAEAEMPTWEQNALAHCAGEVLDIGAGSGCHSLVLQDRGVTVTALDNSPGAIEVMKARGVQSVIESDIFSYQGKTYDTLLMLMNGLGIVGSFDGLREFLDQIPKWLRPGGQIILDSSDLAYLLEDNFVLEEMLNRENAFGEVLFQLCYKEICSDPFPWLYTDADTLASIAHSKGFSCEILAQGDHYEYVAKLMYQAENN